MERAAAIWRAFASALLGEFRAIRSDKGALIIIVAGALAYSLVYPLPYRRQLAREIPIVVIDEDQSALSRQLARMTDAAEQVAIARTVSTMEEGEKLVRNGEVRGAMLIPRDFERSVQRGDRAIIGIYGDASYFMVYNQIATGVSLAVGTLSAGVELRRLQATGLTAAAARIARDPLPLTVRPLYNPSGGYGNTNVPAVLILILQQTLLIGIGSLAGARRETRGAPNEGASTSALERGASLIGKATSYIAIYFVHLALFFGVVYRLYQLPARGSMLVTMWFLVPFLIAVAFLGLAISRLFLERESAIQALLFSSLPALFVSGFSFPAEAMPAWVRAFAQALPSTHGIAGALRLLQMGASLGDVRQQSIALWTLAMVYAAIAYALLPRPTRATTSAAAAPPNERPPTPSLSGQ